VRGLSVAELQAWTAPKQQYIIENILFPKTKMMLHGRFQTWKSMLALYTGATIADGNEWFGIRTSSSTVYNLQIEMPQSQLQKRVNKYLKHNPCTHEDRMWFCTEHYIKLDKGYGVAELERELARTKPQLLIIDPLYRVVSGHITDEYDMRQFMDRMDILIDKYNLALIIVHHDRKYLIQDGVIVDTGADAIFGSSMFIDWLDASIQTSITGMDGEVLVSIEKVKYVEEELKPIRIKIDRNTLTFRKVG